MMLLLSNLFTCLNAAIYIYNTYSQTQLISLVHSFISFYLSLISLTSAAVMVKLNIDFPVIEGPLTVT